jgi:hypothetical protein
MGWKNDSPCWYCSADLAALMALPECWNELAYKEFDRHMSAECLADPLWEHEKRAQGMMEDEYYCDRQQQEDEDDHKPRFAEVELEPLPSLPTTYEGKPVAYKRKDDDCPVCRDYGWDVTDDGNLDSCFTCGNVFGTYEPEYHEPPTWQERARSLRIVREERAKWAKRCPCNNTGIHQCDGIGYGPITYRQHMRFNAADYNQFPGVLMLYRHLIKNWA